MADELSNVLDLVKRDAVAEARAGTSEVPISGAGIGGESGGTIPTTFPLGAGSLRAFKLDVDTLETTANAANQKAYLF